MTSERGSQAMTSPAGAAGPGSRSLASASARMTVGTILSRATGVLRLSALAAALGVAEGRLADSYNLANMVPNLLYALLLGGVLTSVFVPVFVEMLEKEGPEAAWEAANGLINVALLVLAGLSLLGVLLAPWIASFYATRLEGEIAAQQKEVITYLLRLFVPQIIFYGLAAIVGGLLNAHKRFGPPMYAPVLNNLVVIAVFTAFHAAYGRVGLEATERQLFIIGAGTTLGVAAMALVQLPFLRGLGRYRATFASRHSALLKKVAALGGYVIAYMFVTQLGYLAVQWLANAQQGGYSAYFIGYTFYLLPISVFGLSITTALLPDMSRHAANQRWDEFRERWGLGIRATLFLILPAAVGYLVMARPLVELLLENGVVTSSSTALVTDVLQLFLLGLPQGALFTYFVRSFYSMQDTRSPLKLVSVVVAFNFAVNLPLFAWLGVGGLALGQAIAYTLGVALLGKELTKRIGGLDLRGTARRVGRMAAAAAAMGVAVWLALLALRDLVGEGAGILGQGLVVAVPVVVGVLCYLVLAHRLRIEEVDYVRRVLLRKGAARPAAQGDGAF